MNAESVSMSGPSLSQSFDANVEPFLETSECEPVTGAAATQSIPQLRESRNWFDRLIDDLFIKRMADTVCRHG